MTNKSPTRRFGVSKTTETQTSVSPPPAQIAELESVKLKNVSLNFSAPTQSDFTQDDFFDFKEDDFSKEIKEEVLEDVSEYSSFEGRVEKIVYTNHFDSIIFDVKAIQRKPIYAMVNGEKKIQVAPRIIYYNADNLEEIVEGVRLTMSGKWENGERGLQFVATSCTTLAVETDSEIAALLTGGKWKVGRTETLKKETGEAIVEAAKLIGQPLKSFLNSPLELGRVVAVRNIMEEERQKEDEEKSSDLVFLNRNIARAWHLYNQSFLFAEALAKRGLDRGKGRKVFEYICDHRYKFKDETAFEYIKEYFNSLRKVKNEDWMFSIDRELYIKVLEFFAINPYQFTVVKGCGFLSIDKVALQLGIDENSELRLSALIHYAVEEQCIKNSSTVQEKRDIFAEAQKVHNMTEQRFNEIFVANVDSRKLIGRRMDLGKGVGSYFTTAKIFEQEYKVAEGIMRLVEGEIEISEEAIAEIMADKFPAEGPQYCDNSQKLAILNAYKNPVSIITGGPGCGKTFSIRNLIYILDKYECSANEMPVERQEVKKEEKKVVDDLIGTSDFFDDSGVASFSKAEEIILASAFEETLVEIDEIEEQKNIEAKEEKEEQEDNELVSTLRKPKRIMLLAPTGRAAKRMNEMIKLDPRLANKNIQARTIHRLIYPLLASGEKRYMAEWRSDTTFIIDESSMIDVRLMSMFISLLKNNNRLVFVGDVDQLAPVGLGQVMKDLLAFNKISACYLQNVHRVSEGSTIPLLVQGIKHRRVPKFGSDFVNNDYSLIKATSEEQTLQYIKEVIKRLLNDGWSKKDIQVISPQFRGTVGCGTLNVQIRHLLNEGGMNLTEAQTIGQQDFLNGDRVMNTKNNYDKNIFNGDIGLVKNLKRDGRKLSFDFFVDEEVIDIENDLIGNFQLAYAYTIHKSQGSESPVIIIPLSKNHAFSWTNNMIYTGVSRAKEKVILIGEDSIFYKSLHKKEDEKRLTTLLYELSDFDERREGRKKLIEEIKKNQLPVEYDFENM